MVIDTSAVLAILFDEPERRAFVDAIDMDPVQLISTASYLEAAIVLDARAGYDGLSDLRSFLSDADVTHVPVSLEHAETARSAYRRFGRGRHPARLNFGDTLSYALSMEMGESLLFKGNDFTQTDVIPALIR